jgi:hypothetical protein
VCPFVHAHNIECFTSAPCFSSISAVVVCPLWHANSNEKMPSVSDCFTSAPCFSSISAVAVCPLRHAASNEQLPSSWTACREVRGLLLKSGGLICDMIAPALVFSYFGCLCRLQPKRSIHLFRLSSTVLALILG